MEREERKGGGKERKWSGGSKAHGFFFLVERTKRESNQKSKRFIA